VISQHWEAAVEFVIERLPVEKPVVIPEKLGFGQVFSNRMFTQKWTQVQGWHEAKIGPYAPFTLDPSTAVFHYAQEIFEGTKAYRRPDGKINLFRPWENAARFNRSARRMAMPEIDPEGHVAAMAKLVELEAEWVPSQPGASLYIRPTMIATEPALGVHASSSFLHFIIVGPAGPYFATGFNPVSVFVSDKYVRAVAGGVGEAKTGGNYAASLLVGEEVRSLGYQQVLWLDGVERRYVEEVGAMNIAFAYGKHIITPTLTGTILPGITRDSILKLAPDLGYSVSEERIEISRVLTDIDKGDITEVFGIGTAAVIAPVGKFGYQGREYVINNQQAGPASQHLYQHLTDLQYGRIADPYGWTHLVE
jgi:branched-chain amino acid aminotransferase